MHRFAALALALALTAVPVLAHPKKPERALRVITYNIHQSKGVRDMQIGGQEIRLPFGIKLRVPKVDLPVARPGQPGKIADSLRPFDADVIVLQEVNDRAINSWGQDQAAKIAGDLGMHHASRVAQGEGIFGSMKRQANAVLSRWPILAVREVELNREQGNEERRNAVLAKIAPPGVPDGIWVACTHLPAGNDGAELRFADVGKLGRLAARLPGRVIIAGDFNAAPSSEAIAAFLAAASSGGKPLTDAWSKSEGPGGTSSAPHGNSRIDYVFSSAELPPLQAFSPRDVLESDHFMVVADLSTVPVPAAAETPVVAGSTAGAPQGASLLGVGSE